MTSVAEVWRGRRILPPAGDGLLAVLLTVLVVLESATQSGGSYSQPGFDNPAVLLMTLPLA